MKVSRLEFQRFPTMTSLRTRIFLQILRIPEAPSRSLLSQYLRSPTLSHSVNQLQRSSGVNVKRKVTQMKIQRNQIFPSPLNQTPSASIHLPQQSSGANDKKKVIQPKTLRILRVLSRSPLSPSLLNPTPLASVHLSPQSSGAADASREVED
jgi:hypothetical protein